jgi:hypothetical protein
MKRRGSKMIFPPKTQNNLLDVGRREDTMSQKIRSHTTFDRSNKLIENKISTLNPTQANLIKKSMNTQPRDLGSGSPVKRNPTRVTPLGIPPRRNSFFLDETQLDGKSPSLQGSKGFRGSLQVAKADSPPRTVDSPTSTVGSPALTVGSQVP